MSDDPKRYWSHLKSIEECPKQYLLKYGHPDIDLGYGLGKKMPPPPSTRSLHDSVMGSVVGKVFEKFYEEEWFKDPATIEQKAKDRLNATLEKQLVKNYVDWDVITKREMLEVCQNGVSGMIATIKGNRLLGNQYSRSEFEFGGKVSNTITISGKVDLIFGHTQTGVTIIDGKNGKRNKEGKVRVDDGQLQFYALCYYVNYGTLPDRLGWLWFRYPYGTPKEDGGTETGVEWVNVTKADLKALLDRIKAMDARIQAKSFEAKPRVKTCDFCDYESVCEERKVHKEELALKRAAKPSPFSHLIGVAELDFGVDGS